jgi:hypothetical protein
MIAIAMLLAAAGVPQQLLDEGDAANLAHTQCAFAVIRAADAAGLSVAGFKSKLDASCGDEERRLRNASIRIFRARGDPDPEGEARDAVNESKAIVIEDYRKLPEQKRIIEEIGKVCGAHPDECRR